MSYIEDQIGSELMASEKKTIHSKSEVDGDTNTSTTQSEKTALSSLTKPAEDHQRDSYPLWKGLAQKKLCLSMLKLNCQ